MKDYGVLERYLQDEDVIEIMANSDGVVWVDRVTRGMERTEAVMSMEERDSFLRVLASRNGKTIRSDSPSFAGKLKEYNARVQGEIPPVVDSPIFTIRKPTKYVIPLEEYVESEILPKEVAEFIKGEFLKHKTFVISGGTGSGKTSFANALLNTLKDTSERLYIIEDTPELVCNAPNSVNVMIQEQFWYREAVRSSLRHRPDRILVGEVRDSAALDLLKAWNTGHPGGLATVHANSAISVHERLVQLVEESGNHCSLELICEAVDYVVHIEKDKTKKGGRTIKQIIRYTHVEQGKLKVDQVYPKIKQE